MVVESLRSWLRERWPSYDPTRHIEGTYGLVFILEARETNVFPQKCCLKTLNPAKLKPGGDVRALFEREMRLWLSIPFHYYVLPALGLEFAPPPTELASEFEVLPLVRMPFCDASLSLWVRGERTIPVVDRLITLAQVCSGLQWLYQHGLQGHGDLKPDNILLSDLRPRFVLPDGGGFPSKLHPWQARIADLGWADIWSHGGGTYHAWRPYLAPERFHDTVVPEASDIFAFGVIACELLSGIHPGGDRTESLAKRWNKKKWEAWAASTQRLVHVDPPVLRDLVLRCLTADPKGRPTAAHLKVALCDLLKKTHGVELALQVQDEEARKLMLPTHDSWTAEQMSRVSPDQLNTSVSHLEQRLDELRDPRSPAHIASWLATSRALQRLLLRRNHPRDLERVGHLAVGVLDLVLERFHDLDLREEIYGKPLLADLEPEEVLWEFAIEAFNNVKHAAYVDEAKLKSYEARLQAP